VDVAAPATVVLTPGMGAVLRALCGADAAFTVRHLARVAGVSHARTAEIINRLTDHGLVLVNEHGAGKLCRLNRDHLAAGAVCEIVQMRNRLLRLLGDTLDSWAIAPLHASLFGSAARGDGDVHSDLDVLLVRPDGVAPDDEGWEQQLSGAMDLWQRATGNNVSLINVSRADIRRVVRAREPIVDEWRRDAIHLHGMDLPQLLRRAA
jgi:predicted nucleotidyltransferase